MEAQAYQMGGGAGTITQSGAVDTITETSTTTTYSHPSAPTPSYNTGPRIITAPRTRTCPAPVLSNLHPPQSQDMGGAMTGLAGVFGMGDSGAKKSAPPPAGLRMLGEYAVPNGAEIDFHDAAAAIVACGAIAAEYPYTIDVSGSQAVVKLMKSGAPPISLTLGPGHTLTGSGTLQVTGRVVTGEDQNGEMAFASRTASCALGTFSPVTDNTPVTDTPSATSPSPAATSAKPSTPFATPSKPTGPAILTVTSGFPAQTGVANPLAGQAVMLLRDPVAAILAKSGAPVPPHVTAQQAVRTACDAQKPECRTYLLAIGADASTGLKSDATGKAILPGVPAGTYYLTVSTRMGNLVLYWQVKVDLKPGANSITLDTKNAAPVN
jgi:hypothetical protein